MRQQNRGWRCTIWMVLSMWLIAGVWAQNPPYRPNLMWHIAAGWMQLPNSFTEDGEYLLVTSSRYGVGLVQVYQMSALLNPSTPRGHALVSYDYQAGYTLITFTDKDETGKEYVVGLGNPVRMWRWVRDPLAFRGGYLEAPKQWALPGWTNWMTQRTNNYPVAMVLRGDRTDRRYNRLAVSGDGNGALRIVLLDYNAPSLTPVVVSGAHTGPITALAYDPQTRRLITGGRDGLIRVWQVALDAGGTPSLTPLQTIAAHWSDVVSLALAQVGSNRYLVSLSLNYELAGWSWPNPSPTPLWHRMVEPGGPMEEGWDVDQFLSGGTPYGDLNWVMLEIGRAIDYDPSGLRNTMLWLDPATGKEHYRFVGYRRETPLFPRPFIVSPPIGGARYIVGTINQSWGVIGALSGAGGLWPLQLDRVQTFATAPTSATALDTMAVGTTRYLAVGYANGELRVYRNTGTGWNLWDSATNLHPSKQIVGVRLVSQSGAIFTLSADVEGTLVVAQHTGSVTPRANLSTGLTEAKALAFGSDSTSALVAVAGQKDSAPRVEVLRLTWSGTTPTLSPLAGFDVSGEAGPAVSVAFVQTGRADVAVSTGSRVSRWNFANNAYSRALNFGGNRPPSYAAISIAGNALWQAFAFTPRVDDVNTGFNAFWETYDIYGVFGYPILALSAEQAVWGLAYRSTSQDGSYWLMRGRGLTRPSTASNVMGEGLQIALPEAPTAIARDPSNPDLFYVGCLDGSVQQALLPDFTPTVLMGYAGLSGTLFEVMQNRIATFLTSYGPAFRWFGDSGVGIRHAAIVNLTDGLTASSAMQCNADGTGCNPYDAGINALMRLSPSGNVMYGYEVGNNRLTGWNGATMASLFNTTAFPTHWWPIAVDDTRVALLYNEARGSYQLGNPPVTYYRYRPVIRIIKWTPTLTTEAIRPLDENTEMGFIMTNPNSHPSYLQSMRWDMNSTRRVAAVWGAHYYDPNTPNAFERRILILHRPNPNDWGTWVVREVLRQGVDFPGLVYPTLVVFHPNAPGVLYVGLSNGRLRIYKLDANGNLLNRTNPDELVPTLGTLGPVSTLDVGNYVLNGLNYTAIVFGGPEGLSVWVGFVCQPGWLNEVHFYQTDIAFFPNAGMGYVQVEQPDASQWPYLVYSNGLVMSAAKLDNLPQLPCPEDVNRDGIVDDADVLGVLFAFGGEGYIPADVNCDGIVDDADLLQVLFAFGQQC